MRNMPSLKPFIVTAICYLYVLLFVYAAASKILDFQNFRIEVSQSPLLTAFAGFVPAAVIAIEIFIAVLLCIPRTRIAALFAAFAVMVLFSIYIFIILNYSPFIPCSCGGILEDMTWSQHLYFNIGFVLLAITALYFTIPNHAARPFYLPVRLALITVFSILLMVLLFLSSEHIVANSNGFTRRFPPFPAKRGKALELKFDSYYFAGADAGKIYLGNPSAPALVTVIDTALQSVQAIHLSVTDTLLDFKDVQLRVRPPYFYLFDGTVPCVFKGTLQSRKAVLQPYKSPGFSMGEVIDSTTMAVRTLADRQHLLTVVDFGNAGKIKKAPELLEKQIDGIFDTDGSMEYDEGQQKFVYTYYYRNQYIVADRGLNLIHRGNTIDTTTRAKIKVDYIKSKKQRQFSAPPQMVNRITALYGNLLFVNSSMRGEFDTTAMWNNANCVDVYDIQDKTYLMTIYVYKADGEKISDMIATGTHLFVIAGTKLTAYHFSSYIKKKFTKEIPAGNRKPDRKPVKKSRSFINH